MTTITIEVKNPEDVEILTALATRLDCKITKVKNNEEKGNREELKKLFKSIAKRGTLAKAIPDPVKWQKEIRKDKKLLGR
ncbi:MAG: hypothetical protein KDK36_10770 [Leptospiraceae bacterium]|nr:hypothetical protein [Leptospiraceae bacterium]